MNHTSPMRVVQSAGQLAQNDCRPFQGQGAVGGHLIGEGTTLGPGHDNVGPAVIQDAMVVHGQDMRVLKRVGLVCFPAEALQSFLT
jgi:hypothetical protein